MPQVILRRAEIADDEEIDHVIQLLHDHLRNRRIVVVHVKRVHDSPGQSSASQLYVLFAGHDSAPDYLGLAAIGAMPAWLAGTAIRTAAAGVAQLLAGTMLVDTRVPA